MGGKNYDSAQHQQFQIRRKEQRNRCCGRESGIYRGGSRPEAIIVTAPTVEFRVLDAKDRVVQLQHTHACICCPARLDGTKGVFAVLDANDAPVGLIHSVCVREYKAQGGLNSPQLLAKRGYQLPKYSPPLLPGGTVESQQPHLCSLETDLQTATA